MNAYYGLITKLLGVLYKLYKHIFGVPLPQYAVSFIHC